MKKEIARIFFISNSIGFCKLFCLDVIQCESILTALIIEKYNPLTQRFPQTRECLFWFFQTFAGELFPTDDKEV